MFGPVYVAPKPKEASSNVYDTTSTQTFTFRNGPLDHDFPLDREECYPRTMSERIAMWEAEQESRNLKGTGKPGTAAGENSETYPKPFVPTLALGLSDFPDNKPCAAFTCVVSPNEVDDTVKNMKITKEDSE